MCATIISPKTETLTLQDQVNDIDCVISQLIDDQHNQPGRWMSLTMAIGELRQMRRELIQQIEEEECEYYASREEGERDYYRTRASGIDGSVSRPDCKRISNRQTKDALRNAG